MVIHSIVYAWEEFQIFSMCFTICFALKDVWDNFGKLFLGADECLASPDNGSRSGPSPTPILFCY